MLPPIQLMLILMPNDKLALLLAGLAPQLLAYVGRAFHRDSPELVPECNHGERTIGIEPELAKAMQERVDLMVAMMEFHDDLRFVLIVLARAKLNAVARQQLLE